MKKYAFVLIGLVYILLCSMQLTNSIWFDESFGAYLLRYDLAEIWSFTAADVHPPLYYFLLKGWSLVFGYSDVALRFMSVFFGAVAIVFAYQWLKNSFGYKVAIISSALMAISPMMIRYGEEMRMYSLCVAIVFAATYVFSIALRTKQKKYWYIYGVLLALGMWTHYFVALLWVAHLVYLLMIYGKKIWKQKEIVRGYILAVVLYLPWLPWFISQSLTVQGGFWIGEASVNTVNNYITNSLVYLDANTALSWVMFLVMFVVVMAIIFVPRVYKKLKGEEKTAYTLLILMTVLPPVVLLVLSLPPLSPMFVDRYVVYSMVSLTLLLGVTFVLMVPKKALVGRKWLAGVSVAALVLAGVIGVQNVYELGNYNKVTHNRSDVKSLFEGVVEHSASGVPIVSDNEWMFYDLVFYSSDEYPVYFLDELVEYAWGSHVPLRDGGYGKIDDLDGWLSEHETFWYVGPAESKLDVLEFPRENVEMIQRFYSNTIVPDGVGYVAIEYRVL